VQQGGTFGLGEMAKKDGYEDFQERVFDTIDTLEASARQRTVKSNILCEHERPMWAPCRKCRRNRSAAEDWLSKWEKKPLKIYEEK
jgi:hypothetical protein